MIRLLSTFCECIASFRRTAIFLPALFRPVTFRALTVTTVIKAPERSLPCRGVDYGCNTLAAVATDGIHDDLVTPRCVPARVDSPTSASRKPERRKRW